MSCGALSLTFIREPSLVATNARRRGLLQAYARSHASRMSRRSTGHSPTKTRTRGVTTRNDGSARTHSEDEEELSLLSKSTEANKPVKMVWTLQELAPIYSSYLHETYGGMILHHINAAFDYYINVAGPIYIWRTVNTESERSYWEFKMVENFLNEPALTEVLIAWLHCLRRRHGVIDGSPPYASLFHQQKSLSLLRRVLDDDENALRDSTIWTIIGNLELNRLCDDWVSLNVNLKGLERVITLIGGMDALKKRNYRAYIFVTGFSNIVPNNDTTAPSLRSRATVQEADTSTSDRGIGLSEDGPDGISQLHQEEKLREVCATTLVRSANLVRMSNRLVGGTLVGPDDDSLETEKPRAEQVLWDMLHDASLNDVEYTLCLGMLVKLATSSPPGDILSELCAPLVATALFKRLHNFAGTAVTWHWYTLWTCMVMMEMPLYLSPGLYERLDLLRVLVPLDRECPSWLDIRKGLARYYLDDDTAAAWKVCWESLVEPAIGTPRPRRSSD